MLIRRGSSGASSWKNESSLTKLLTSDNTIGIIIAVVAVFDIQTDKNQLINMIPNNSLNQNEND